MSTNRSEYGWNSTLRRKKPGKEALQKERKPMARKTPMKKVSKKQAARLKEYSELRKEFLLQNPICAITGLPASDVHHIKRRGPCLLDVSTWLPVSREAHQRIHDNPQWAKQNGYLE